MKLMVAGGCGEHGRNCFFAEDARFIVDCGVMEGAPDPYPWLSAAQIRTVEWLFITHSHLDHTGAYPWLVEQGFTGCVVMTRETARQLPFSPPHVRILDEMTPAFSPISLSENLSFCWGRSGQCAGSVWFNVTYKGERVIFSGDYTEESLIYGCDPIRGIAASLAVLDSAYGSSTQTPSDCRAAFIETVKRFQGQSILFPVPKFGRGLELILLLRRNFPFVPLWPDTHLREELSRISQYEEWLKPDIAAELRAIEKTLGSPISGEEGFYFISDPQLKSPTARRIAETIESEGGKIIITGYADQNSFSDALLHSKRAVFSRIAVHMTDTERMALESVNVFLEKLPYHR